MHMALHILALEQLETLHIPTRNYLQNQDLKDPDESPWHHIYNTGSDPALINTISLTRAAFENLLLNFKQYSI
jgi:hypothetical protein